MRENAENIRNYNFDESRFSTNAKTRRILVQKKINFIYDVKSDSKKNISIIFCAISVYTCFYYYFV